MSADGDIPGQLAWLKALAPAGFAVALHVRYQTPTYLFQTYPAAWIEEYGRMGLLMRDPTVVWSFAHTGTVSWAELSEADPAGVMARAAAHGLHHGVTVSLDRGGTRSLASFARADREFRPDEVEAIEAAMVDLHDGTASAQPLSAATREQLRRLSVAVTHP